MAGLPAPVAGLVVGLLSFEKVELLPTRSWIPASKGLAYLARILLVFEHRSVFELRSVLVAIPIFCGDGA